MSQEAECSAAAGINGMDWADEDEGDGEDAWKHLNKWTLRFQHEAANKAFWNLRTLTTLPQQDRYACILSPLIMSSTLTKLGAWSKLWESGYWLELLLIVSLTALSTSRHTWAKKAYLHLRTPLILTLRMAAIRSALWHCNQIALLPQSGSGTQPYLRTAHVVLISCMGGLFLVSLGAVLPFWLHVITLPAMLSVLWAPGAMTNITTSLCDGYAYEVSTMHESLSLISAAADPSHWLMPYDFDVDSVYPRAAGCPAMQLMVYIQLSLGVVLPTVLLYRMELVARSRFLRQYAQQVLGPGVRVRMPEDEDGILQRGMHAAQYCMGLATLWEVLQVVMGAHTGESL